MAAACANVQAALVIVLLLRRVSAADLLYTAVTIDNIVVSTGDRRDPLQKAVFAVTDRAAVAQCPTTPAVSY